MTPRNPSAPSQRFAILLGASALLLAASLFVSLSASAAPQEKKEQPKLQASAIQVLRTNPSDTLTMPEDFRVALYEHVIQELENTKKFQKVFRDGDRTAEAVPDIVVLKISPVIYKAGSQKEREVTTIKGATDIKVNLLFSKRDGTVVLEQPVEGKVRFYGENLAATKDVAKKIAALVKERF